MTIHTKNDSASSGIPGLDDVQGGAGFSRNPDVPDRRQSRCGKDRASPVALMDLREAGLSVLVVEDNDDARETMQLLLETWGHRVDTAADGREGLEKLLAAQPDVAIVDIGLPKIDGYEVARQARACIGAAPRLIAVTGYGQPEDRRRALEAGFDHHLAKPVQVDDLSRLLRTRAGEPKQRVPVAPRR